MDRRVTPPKWVTSPTAVPRLHVNKPLEKPQTFPNTVQLTGMYNMQITRWGLASQSPYPIIVYSVANYRPHLSHFRANK